MESSNEPKHNGSLSCGYTPEEHERISSENTLLRAISKDIKEMTKLAEKVNQDQISKNQV